MKPHFHLLLMVTLIVAFAIAIVKLRSDIGRLKEHERITNEIAFPQTRLRIIESVDLGVVCIANERFLLQEET